MAERPLLLKESEVRAILDGRKTQMRRPVDRKKFACVDWGYARVGDRCHTLAEHAYGRPGDLLWVRESWAQPGTVARSDDPVRSDRPVVYKASESSAYSWRSPITMPRWAARLSLRITGVSVERLQDIREIDARAEGVGDWQPDSMRYWSHFPVEDFRKQWSASPGQGAWADNPWVWVLKFDPVITRAGTLERVA